MKKSLKVSLGVLVFLFAFAATTASAVGMNGSFESGAPAGGFITLFATNNTDITNWTVDGGSVDYIGGYWAAIDGTHSIDMNGFAAGSVSQVLTTIPGAKYDVSFYMSGNPDSRSDVNDPYYSPSNKVLRVNNTGGVFQDFNFDPSLKQNSYQNMMWEPHTYSFTATGTSTTLTFSSQIPGAFGPALDNVSITETLPPALTNKDQCKDNGWKTFTNPSFKNQGECVSFVQANPKAGK